MEDEEMLTYEEAVNEIKWLACRTGSPTARRAIEMAVHALYFEQAIKNNIRGGTDV